MIIIAWEAVGEGFDDLMVSPIIPPTPPPDGALDEVRALPVSVIGFMVAHLFRAYMNVDRLFRVTNRCMHEDENFQYYKT